MLLRDKLTHMLVYSNFLILIQQLSLNVVLMTPHQVCHFVGTPSAECCSKRNFPHKGDSEFISSSQGTKAKLLPTLSSNLQSNVFVLCPQLHHAVVKHKALILVQ
jgi:hypothetical protein